MTAPTRRPGSGGAHGRWAAEAGRGAHAAGWVDAGSSGVAEAAGCCFVAEARRVAGRGAEAGGCWSSKWHVETCVQTQVPDAVTESKPVVELDRTEREPAVESDRNRTAIYVPNTAPDTCHCTFQIRTWTCQIRAIVSRYMLWNTCISVQIYVLVRAQIRPETRTLIHANTYPHIRTKIRTSMAWAYWYVFFANTYQIWTNTLADVDPGPPLYTWTLCCNSGFAGPGGITLHSGMWMVIKF